MTQSALKHSDDTINTTAAARGRPKSEAKREQIFAAASALFPQLGFDNVSMDKVAEQAGVSKQTVYSHFRNKDELYSACISRCCIAYQMSPEFMDTDKPVADMLREIGRRFLGLLLSKEALHIYRLSVSNACQHPHLAALFYNAGPVPTTQAVSDYLQQQHEKGVLTIPDARTAASQFLYMLRGDVVTRATLNIQPQPTVAERDTYIESCVQMFLRAYGTRETAAAE